MKQNFRMIDVGEKQITRRRAIACGKINVCTATMEMIKKGSSPKGDILAISEVAGIMAAKNTSALLPLCHPLFLDSVKLWFEFHENTVTAFCEVICHAKTGVEMEALVGVNTCLLTIYDLAKAVDPVIEIFDIHLVSKEGGKSGHWIHPKIQEMTGSAIEKSSNKKENAKLSGVRFAVLTLSDRAFRGIYEDKAGPILKDYLSAMDGIEIGSKIIPDEKQKLLDEVTALVERGVELIALTGGTGLSDRDITPETIKAIATKELTGLGELQRQYGSHFTKLAWLSRSSAFVVGSSLVILFPGSPKAVTEGFHAIGELLPHAIKMVRGGTH